MTLGHYIAVLRRRWRIVTLFVVLFLTLAATATALMPTTYSAQARAFVTITSDGSDPGSLYQDSQYALNRVQSYPQIAQSPQVLEAVVDDLDLTISPEELRGRFTVVNPVDTVLLEVQATSGDPGEAAAIANSVAEQLGRQIEEVEAPPGSASSPVRVTTPVPALPPTSPVSPRPPLNLVLGLLLGLALGAAAALIRDRFDTTVKNPEEVTALTGASPLGLIREDARFAEQPLATLHSDWSVVEDYRSVRTALRFVDVDHPPRQIVITSALPGEGKSTFACNLALTLSQTGARVCVVEADLRRPRASAFLGIDAGLGLADVIAGEVPLDDALVRWGDGELTVLPAGTTPPDPSSILDSHMMEGLLTALTERFDHVIIDAPPALAVSDAAILGAASDGVVLVAQHRRVRRAQLRLALARFDSVGARVLGVVLNRMRPKDREERYGPDYVTGGHTINDVDAGHFQNRTTTTSRTPPTQRAQPAGGRA